MASLNLPTKNQFAFTYATTPTGDDIITIGHNLFTRKKETSSWAHGVLADYFTGHTLKTDQEKHDAVTFPIDSLDKHFFTSNGVEVIIASRLVFYRPYPAEVEWHVTDHPNIELSPNNDVSLNKRLIISPIANVSLEGNTMFVESGNTGFEFVLQDAPRTPQTYRCKSCHETFTTINHSHATTICSHCSCADSTRLT